VDGFSSDRRADARYPAERAAEKLRIEVTPLVAAAGAWAFVSVTNNETQHITTITPQ
jgi:hypothetical protein